ncbi:unnamed protein product [Rotaria sp. Silwood2]|nr:unnamed protein product [Rotaria sp. Silwood2]
MNIHLFPCFVPLTKCDLTLVDVRSVDQPVPTINPKIRSITSILDRTFYYAQVGQILLKQHNLGLTTVTSIPMKEDVD